MAGEKVRSKAFGEGTVKALSGPYITIIFSIGEKDFPFPNAFDGFLSTEDTGLLAEIERRKKANKEEEARLENEARLAEEARRKEQARQAERIAAAAQARMQEASEAGKKPRKTNAPEGPNLAFKCNFCDGGRSKDCVGFRGVCSDQCIDYNIEEAKHVWCASDSPCKKYYDRIITRKELDSTDEMVCYESRILTDWKFFAGVVQYGYNSGRPMKFKQSRENSLAILTTRDPDTPDTRRYIFAVFLIDEYFDGDERDSGYVACNSKWRIELRPDEAHQILFWNYYWNQNAPQKAVFGSGLHRYLSDIKAAQILRDIIAVRKSPDEKAFATEFFEHFCKIAKIKCEDLPEPRGALYQ